MIGSVLQVELEELIQQKQWDALREVLTQLDPSDISELILDLPDEDDAAIFRVLPRNVAAEVFAYLPLEHQEALLRTFTNDQMRTVVDGMSPDDRTRLLEELPSEFTRRLLEVLSPDELKTARELLGYPPDTAGRYMTPRYVSILPEMTARGALEHVRGVARDKETLNVLYVVAESGKLLKEIRLGTLVLADPTTSVAHIEDRPLVSILASVDREQVVAEFRKYDRVVLPVVDSEGHMLGIITADDVIDVAEQEATEDMQKLGGSEALDRPYFEVSFAEMVRKRGGWLAALFLGEMLTATAMGYFEGEIEKAAVVALFVPLIISSGGNSGSQGTSLIIRSLALREVKLADWWRVLGRELRVGLALGLFLGVIGLVRISAWQGLSHVPHVGSFFASQAGQLPEGAPAGSTVLRESVALREPITLPVGSVVEKGTSVPDGAVMPGEFHTSRPEITAYGDYWFRIGLTVLIALIGVITWGTLAGSMLPFLLRRLGFDPATSSAPFVATLVDVTGLVIYFSVASVVLRGTLL
ncbi:MAG: magnesium transporter [Tepidisphaeraceae bacterium]